MMILGYIPSTSSPLQRDIFAYAKKRVAILSRHYRSLPMNQHDWDDFAQDILIHLHRREHLRDKTRHYGPWVKTVIGNKLVNLIRDRAVISKHFPMTPFVSRLVAEDAFGDPVIHYTPDLAQPEDRTEVTREVIESLPKDLRVFTQRFVTYGSWRRAGGWFEWGHLKCYAMRDEVVRLVRARIDQLS